MKACAALLLWGTVSALHTVVQVKQNYILYMFLNLDNQLDNLGVHFGVQFNFLILLLRYAYLLLGI